MNEAEVFEGILKEYYKNCNHQCDNCPFANECTHYEPTESGMVQ